MKNKVRMITYLRFIISALVVIVALLVEMGMGIV